MCWFWGRFGGGAAVPDLSDGWLKSLASIRDPINNARNALHARTRVRVRAGTGVRAYALLTHKYLLTYCYQLLKTNKQNSVSVCYVCC